MDVQRCITLHNDILLNGWTNAGHDANTFESHCKTWYDSAPEEAENIRDDLKPNLFEFLSQARQPIDQSFSFFYYVSDLAHPNCLFMDYEKWQYDVEEGEEKRYVTLYMANRLGSHPLGLIFDQVTSLAIFLPTIWDMEDHFTDKAFWRPLETILQMWLNMIHKGKIIAKPKEYYAAQAKRPTYQDPWMLVPYSKTILDETVETFNYLVQAIEDRLTNPSVPINEKPIIGLVDEEILETMCLPPGFLHSFLTRARRPRFHFIAPGLCIPTPTTITSQPFWAYLSDPKSGFHLPPTLLFASTHPYTSPQPPTDPPPTGLAAYTTPLHALLKTSWHIYSHARSISSAIRTISTHYSRTTELARQDPNSPFPYPFSKTLTYNAGLYLSPSSTAAQDEVTLLLPACVAGDGCARMSDGEPAKIESEVYGIGFTAFKAWAEPRLLDVVRHWVRMVESGEWGVDCDGVEGGIEMWRGADEREGERWRRYVLPVPED